MSNSHCGVCDVYFCGDIPARQHYDGQKHSKKLKKFKTENPNATEAGKGTVAIPEKGLKSRIEETPVVSKVGIDLEYCELCEVKLSPNPVQAARHYSSPGHLKVQTPFFFKQEFLAEEFCTKFDPLNYFSVRRSSYHLKAWEFKNLRAFDFFNY